MEWIIVGVLILFLLGCGFFTANGAFWCSEAMKQPIGRKSLLIGAVILPILLLSVVWIYNGIAVCSCCNSITVNTYNEAKWIVETDVCSDCVKYIECNSTKHIIVSPPRPQVCLSCEGNIYMNNDEIEEDLVFASLIVWAIGHWGTMIVIGCIRLIKKYKRNVEVEL